MDTRDRLILRTAEACLPNMRLKLPGASVFREAECLCAGAHELSFSYTTPCEHVARSLSAIR